MREASCLTSQPLLFLYELYIYIYCTVIHLSSVKNILTID